MSTPNQPHGNPGQPLHLAVKNKAPAPRPALVNPIMNPSALAAMATAAAAATAAMAASAAAAQTAAAAATATAADTLAVALQPGAKPGVLLMGPAAIAPPVRAPSPKKPSVAHHAASHSTSAPPVASDQTARGPTQSARNLKRVVTPGAASVSLRLLTLHDASANLRGLSPGSSLLWINLGEIPKKEGVDENSQQTVVTKCELCCINNVEYVIISCVQLFSTVS
ncbi:hypothetical protein Pelo_16130 [Pelomyxa schiedti]|nr:hypothetical protein Pelo_16130 [Pelomyxa schiedti]